MWAPVRMWVRSQGSRGRPSGRSHLVKVSIGVRGY
jgi:hypothetical protein